MTVLLLDSIEDPRVQPYRTLRRPLEHQREGIFVAEGEKVVKRLLASSIEIVSMLLTPDWLEVYRATLEMKTSNIQVFVAQKSLLESIVGFHLHQGIMAVAKIPRLLSLNDALAQSRRPLLFAAADALTNAENLGVLVRNCAAFDVDALLVGETSSSPYLRRAVRNSMGTVFGLSVVHVPNLVAAIHEMQSSHGIYIVAAHPHADRKTLQRSSLIGDCCIVFGSEGKGLTPAVLAACDEAVAIPMKDGVDSLNVASASAVFLYEAQRQRRISDFGGGRR